MKATGVTHVLVCAQELPTKFRKSFAYKKLNLVMRYSFMRLAVPRNQVAGAGLNVFHSHCVGGQPWPKH